MGASGLTLRACLRVASVIGDADRDLLIGERKHFFEPDKKKTTKRVR